MGRMLIWAVLAAAVGCVGWFLFGEPEPDAPAYGPMGEIEGDGEEAYEGPGLVGRESATDDADTGDPAGSAWIAGIVVDHAGRPLSGVRVGAAPHPAHERATNASQRDAALALFAPMQGVGRRAVAHDTTGSAGRFRIDGLIADRQYSLIAEVAPPRVASMPSPTARTTVHTGVRIVVGEGSALRGRVVDGSGAGVRADVNVRAGQVLGGKPWLDTGWTRPPFATQPDGRFTLDAVPHGSLVFSVHVAGVGSRTGIRVDAPTDEEVILRLDEPDGATVTGRVTDTGGMPIAGAKLTLSSGPDVGDVGRTSVARAAVTAADGTYTVTGLVPGVIHGVHAYADGYVPSGALANQMPLSRERPARVDVVLVKGITIRGRVLSPDGTPLGGAEVAATRMGAWQGGWFATLALTTSAADGTYTLENVALGPGLVQARLADHFMPPSEQGASNPYPWMQNAMQGTPYEASDEGQALDGKDVVLAKGTVVRGRVVDEAGAPLPDALVSAARQNQGWSPGLANLARGTATTDGEGRFEFGGLEPDTTWNFTVRTRTHVTEKAVPVTLPRAGPPEKEPELVAKLGGTVTGVVSEGGGGVGGVTVRVRGATPVSTHTAPDGAFELAGLMPGTWTVEARGITPTPESAQKTITVTWGKRIEDVALAMPPVYTIGGTVENDEGEPLSGISVRARGSSPSGDRRRRGASKYATTNAAGVFEIQGLVEGEYTVSAGSASEKNVSTGTGDLRLIVAKPERILVEGRVLDAQGQPVVRGSVRIYSGPTGKRRSATNAPIVGGMFSARVSTRESAVDAEVTAAFDATGRALNFIKQREKDLSLSGTIELRLDEGELLAGTVRSNTGTPLAGMLVRVQKKGGARVNPWGNQHGGDGGQARSGEDGRWTVRGLKPGDYTVELTPGGAWITPVPIPARAGDANVEIVLQRGVTIEGRVLTPEGTPLAGAQVWLAETPASKKARGAARPGHDWMAHMRLRTQAGADGRFVVKGLPEDGSFHVSAAGSGAQQPYVSETLQDVAAGTKTVELVLRRGSMIEGEVIAPGGAVIRNGWIQAEPIDKDGGRKSATTQLDGRTTFKLGPLLPGRYKVTLQLRGGAWAAPAAQEIRAPATGVRFEVKKAASIRGTLAGSDVEGFQVQFASQGSVQTGTVRADGSWKVDGCKSTSGTLFAVKRGDDRYAKLEGAEPGKGPYDLTLVVGESITGRLDGWDGSQRKPNVYCMAGGRWVQGVVHDDGTFEIRGLPPGEYSVQGWVSGGTIKATQATPSGTKDLTLEVTYNQK